MVTHLHDLLDLRARQVHTEATIVADDPLEIVTPAAQWSYAAWTITTHEAPVADASARIAVTARIRVVSGRIGVGWTLAGSDVFLSEHYVAEGGDEAIVVRVPADALPGRLMFRNVNPSGPSRFVLHGVDARLETTTPPYPVTVEHRSARSDAAVSVSSPQLFDEDLAVTINRARLDFLASLELPLTGKRVLDAGCGVGWHTPFYTSRGCRVIGIDGRPENITVMKERYPEVEGIVGDLQDMDLERLGSFDVVHCFGLLYHLESPVAALRRLASVCREYLILETMVCDARKPVVMLADESHSTNQALAGLGCRPSPSFVAMALDRLGFQYVYGTTDPPNHPDFLFEWRDTLDVTRAGYNLRCMFVASRAPIQNGRLVELISGE